MGVEDKQRTDAEAARLTQRFIADREQWEGSGGVKMEGKDRKGRGRSSGKEEKPQKFHYKYQFENGRQVTQQLVNFLSF